MRPTVHLHKPAPGSRRRVIVTSIAAVVLTVVGVAAFEYDVAHAVHTPKATRAVASEARALPALPPAWRATATDSSVPQASEVFTAPAALPLESETPPSF